MGNNNNWIGLLVTFSTSGVQPIHETACMGKGHRAHSSLTQTTEPQVKLLQEPVPQLSNNLSFLSLEQLGRLVGGLHQASRGLPFATRVLTQPPTWRWDYKV